MEKDRNLMKDWICNDCRPDKIPNLERDPMSIIIENA